MVAEAAAGKSKHHQLLAQQKAAAKQKKHVSVHGPTASASTSTPVTAADTAEKEKTEKAATS
jgi:hypothetical protein